MQGETSSDRWWERFGIPLGSPFLISPDFSYDAELNEFFYSADMLPTSINTRVGYARDMMLFLNFLHRARSGIGWENATEEDHRAYLIWRRQDPDGPRVSGATWDREVSAQNRFYRWQLSRGRVAQNPVPQRAQRARPGAHNRHQTGQTAATYSHDARRDRIRWLPAPAYRRWRDVGLRGYTAEGLPDAHFRGRWATRNATFTDLLVRTGLRLTEQASILTMEVPTAASYTYPRFWLAESVAKGGSARWVYVPKGVLREIESYQTVDRRLVVQAARARGQYSKAGTGLLDANSRFVTTTSKDGMRFRTPITHFSPEERRGLFVESEEGYEPAALWLTERGDPMAVSTWQDMFRVANQRCTTHGVQLTAHAHLLRHTFAVLTLEQLQRGHIAALGGQTPQQRGQYVRAFGDPLDWVRRALGHRSVTTTQVYLHALEELEMETRLALIPDDWESPHFPRDEAGNR